MTESRFFTSFPAFKHNPTVPISEEFLRLAQQRGWKQGSATWRKQWRRCMNLEYDRLIGKRLVGLADWIELCWELGLGLEYTSITQCKRALSGIYVNLVDLLDSRVRGTAVQKFPNLKSLREYTNRTGRFFAREVVKQDKLLRILLRHLT